MTCTNCKVADDFTGIEVPGVYDGVAYWSCNRCGYKWHRFSKDDWRHDSLNRFLPWANLGVAQKKASTP